MRETSGTDAQYAAITTVSALVLLADEHGRRQLTGKLLRQVEISTLILERVWNRTYAARWTSLTQKGMV